jgi:hypothetical protein
MSFILFPRVVGPLRGGNRLGNWAEGTGVSLYTVDTICCGSEGDTLRVEMVVVCRSGGLGLDWPRILRLSKAKRTSTPGVPWLVAGVGNVGESPTQRWLSCIFLQTTLCLFRLALAGLEQPSGRDGKWTLG